MKGKGADVRTWELCRAIADYGTGVGTHRLAVAVGRTERCVRYWTHDPMEAEGADGHPNLFDWWLAVVDALASTPRARPVALLLEHWTQRQLERALHQSDPGPATAAELREAFGRLLADLGETSREFLVKNDLPAARREALQDMDKLRRFVALLDATIEAHDVTPMRRQA